MQWWLIGFLPITGPAQYEIFHGSQAQAQAKANLAVNGTLHGPYATQAEAIAAEKGLPKSLQQTPTGSEQAIKNAAGSGLHGIADVGKFFSTLGQRETWVRVAEVVLGTALILVALAHMTGIGTKTPVGRALKIAKGVTHGSPKHAAPAPGPRSMAQGKHAKTGPNAPAQGKHAKT